MLERYALHLVEKNLLHFPAVGLLGARQIGKTTLAQYIASRQPSLYLDLENYQDLIKLEDPISYLDFHRDKLIILDEIQRKPEIFMVLRGLIDKNRRSGHRNGQFLILGSASIELLKQSSESLAGRIIYVEMAPLTVREISETREDFYRLWLCGGFPDSFLNPSLEMSIAWRQSFIKTYLERDIPQFGPRIPSESLRRLWTMLAHFQGNPLNASVLGKNLSLSGQTITRYIDLLSDLFLLRRLPPWHGNLSKRLVKSPKIYVRDSGILHALLNISCQEDLLSHPILGASWEGFVIDNLLSFLPQGAQACFYRTAKGAEIDLVLSLPDRRLLAIEIKRSSTPKVQRGFYEACQDINPTHRFVVYDGNERFPLRENTIAVGLKDMIKEIS